ncbi:MFS transporter [Longirhabdus pacifica]|uniref:MFS transporter n=1 Tax=Longirhabdus pacifica TaxID=2305227 RepID=UPI001008B5CD|nr:MFS transporter [Longirhabdus pacifica]
METKTEQKAKPMYHILTNRNFLYVFLGNSIGHYTFYFFIYVLPFVIYEMTNSPFAMSTMRAIEMIPPILLGLVIGVIIDRYNRKMILLLSIALQVLCITFIVVGMYQSFITIWMIYVVGFFVFLFSNMFNNTYHSIIPQIVAKDELTEANSLQMMIMSIFRIAGPAVVLSIVALIGYEQGFIICIIGLVLLFTFVTLLQLDSIEKEEQPEKKEKKSFVKDIKEGWHELTSNKTLWTLTLIILGLNISQSTTGAVFIFNVIDNLEAEIGQVGLVQSVTGIGALLGSLLARKTKEKFNRGQVMLFMMTISFTSQIIYFLAPNYIILACGTFLMGSSVSIVNIHFMTIRQETTPNHLLGRVSGTTLMLSNLAMPIAYLLVGGIGEWVNVKYMFLVSASITLSMLFVAFKARISRFT